MSETLSVAADFNTGYDNLNSELDSVITNNNAVAEKSDSEDSEKLPDWLLPLYMLVTANADAVRDWPWGPRMPLSKSMWSLGEVFPDSVGGIMSQISELLFRTEEAEEDEPEEEPDKTAEKSGKTEEIVKKGDAKTQAQKVQKKINKADSRIQIKNEIEAATHLELPTTLKNKAAKPEALAIPSKKSAVPIPESIISKSSQESPVIKRAVEAKQQIPAFEISEAAVAVKTIAEAESVPDRSQATIDPKIEPFVLPAAIEATAPDPKETLPLHLENLTISGDFTQESDEKIEVAGDEPAQAELDSQESVNQLVNFSEDELMSEPLREVDMIPGELYEPSHTLTPEVENQVIFPEPSNEPHLSEQIETTNPEQPIQNDIAINEIEDSLIQLTERIKISEPRSTESINEILDKIIEVPVKLGSQTNENIINEAQVQEELQELFTELFAMMGIDCSPELIESLSRLPLEFHLTDEIADLKIEEETKKIPQDSGTHEIIKKLLAGLSIIKKALAHASAIGKSALRLYTFDLQPEINA